MQASALTYTQVKPLTQTTDHSEKKNIIKAIRPTRPPLSKPVPGPSCALCYQMKNSPGLNLQNSPKVIFARRRCSSVSARQHFGLIFRICPTALSSQPLHPPRPHPSVKSPLYSVEEAEEMEAGGVGRESGGGSLQEEFLY